MLHLLVVHCCLAALMLSTFGLETLPRFIVALCKLIGQLNILHTKRSDFLFFFTVNKTPLLYEVILGGIHGHVREFRS